MARSSLTHGTVSKASRSMPGSCATACIPFLLSLVMRRTALQGSLTLGSSVICGHPHLQPSLMEVHQLLLSHALSKAATVLRSIRNCSSERPT